MSRLRPRPLTRRGLVLLLIGVGLFAVIDGFSLAVLKEDRVNYGRVVAGVVVERLSSTGEDGTRTVGGSRAWKRDVGMAGFDPYSTAIRVLASGSGSAYVIRYTYPCGVAPHICSQTEFVDHEVWSRLRPGAPVKVRQSVGEKSTARLDDNPQARIALVTAAFGCLLLMSAAILSGRIRFRAAPKYVKAAAVVTSVEEVAYGDEKRWRITFRYFDANSEPQESIDEANDPSWQIGESCVAVYRPQAPDMATLQPLPSHSHP